MLVPPAPPSAAPHSSPVVGSPAPPGRRRRWGLRVLTGALLALGAVTSVGSAPTAWAHDELTGTVPADGSTVATAPDRVVLHFGEAPVTVGLAVRVSGPTGDVQDGTARVDGNDVVQPLTSAMPAGAYRVAWRVTAADGHASSGELTFTAAAGAEAATAAPGVEAPIPSRPAPTASAGVSPMATAVVVVVVLLALSAGVLTRRSRRARTGD